jgi:AcrR family transcriptional regulator
MSRHHARARSSATERPPRRSQAERAEQMRARLLDATIECLSESGYGRMSTNDIVRKARVSRGALAHHFPAKADLVKAAAQRLVDQRGEQFHERFAAIDPQRRTPAEALAVLWSFYDDPSGLALIELSVAARSHPELRSILQPMSKQIETITAEVVVEYFPDLAALPFIEEALRAIHAMYVGLAVSGLAGKEAVDHAAEVRAFLKVLVSMTGALEPILSGPLELVRSNQ